MEEMQARGEPLRIPDAGDGGYLLRALFEVGPTTVDGMAGEQPLRWLDLWAYGQATGSLSDPWDYRTLHEMSRAYLRGKRTGESPFGIAPVDQDRDER